MKKNEGKPQLSLMYTSFMEEVVRVREYGIKKHGSSDGWLTTTTIEHIDATLRHIMDFKSFLLGEAVGEEFDLESGFHHLAHAGCNLMFEIERIHLNIKMTTAEAWNKAGELGKEKRNVCVNCGQTLKEERNE